LNLRIKSRHPLNTAAWLHGWRKVGLAPWGKNGENVIRADRLASWAALIAGPPPGLQVERRTLFVLGCFMGSGIASMTNGR